MTSEHRPTHVLLVEDHDVNRQLAQFVLERAGCRVTLAADGLEALAAVRAERPDLVLMDIRMPLLDGYEATLRLKADPETAAIPVVALSANAMPHEKARALEVGCLAHIEKPIDVLRFVAQLDALLPGKFLPPRSERG